VLQTQTTHQTNKRRGRKVGLALAGGGPLGGIYEIGSLLALNEALKGADLHNVDAYVGVSAGAFVASTLANGVSSEEMASLLLNRRGRPQRFDPTLFLKPAIGEYARRVSRLPGIVAGGLWDYVRHPLNKGFLEAMSGVTQAVPTAVFDNRPIERFLADLFRNRGMTNDFRKLNHRLLIVAVDLDTGGAVRFGADGHDDVPISKAVQASTALPGLYPPVEINGRFYVDGGLKRTLHASAALDEGIDLLFCINPIVPYDASVAPSAPEKRHDTLVEGGLPVVLSQTFRSMIHSRMKVGMAKYDTAYTDRDVLLFEPDRHDSKMFFTNVFSYASRENVCQHAYRTTRRDLLARRRDLEPILRRHGISLDLEVLKDPARHFTAALAGTEGERELGVYKNPVTNRLSRALDRLEGALRL
jgi:predicted acylesterase/phospholipase RssA